MIKQISIALVFSIASATAVADSQRAPYQNPPSRQETTGFFSGAVLGGLAGGPPGVIVGAAFGALFGEGWRAKSEVGELQAKLYENQLRLAALQEETEFDASAASISTTASRSAFNRSRPKSILPMWRCPHPPAATTQCFHLISAAAPAQSRRTMKNN